MPPIVTLYVDPLINVNDRVTVGPVEVVILPVDVNNIPILPNTFNTLLANTPRSNTNPFTMSHRIVHELHCNVPDADNIIPDTHDGDNNDDDDQEPDKYGIVEFVSEPKYNNVEHEIVPDIA